MNNCITQTSYAFITFVKFSPGDGRPIQPLLSGKYILRTKLYGPERRKESLSKHTCN